MFQPVMLQLSYEDDGATIFIEKIYKKRSQYGMLTWGIINVKWTDTKLAANIHQWHINTSLEEFWFSGHDTTGPKFWQIILSNNVLSK